MFKIPLAIWIANAAARLAGAYGDVTQQAEAAQCSRQTLYDHAKKVQAAVEVEHAGGPTHAELIQENQHLRQENARLWDWLAQTVEFPPSKQQEFTVTAAAMGLSLSQILTLLALILGTQVRPGRGTLGRWVQAAGIAAGRVLKHLDWRCRALVLVGCLDEIFFHGRPVLVGVEPASMTWFLGHKADDRTGATWCQHLQTWTSLEYVLADAGTGLQAGIASVQQPRRAAHPAGERPGCLPYAPGGRAGLEPGVGPGRDALGRGGSGGPPGGAGAAADRGYARRGHRRGYGLDEGGSGLHSVRGGRRGLGPGAIGVARVPSGRPVERSGLGAGADHLGRAPAVRTTLVQGPRVPAGGGHADLPGSVASSVAGGGTGSGVACGVGAAVVAAPPAPAGLARRADDRLRSCGAPGATGGVSGSGCALGEVVPAGVRRAASDGAGQQCGGVHEQRAADASVTAPYGDAGPAGPEASVLELPCVWRREAAGPLPV